MTRAEKAELLGHFCGRNEEPCKYCKLETYCVRVDGEFSKLTDLELDSALSLIAEEIETEPPVDNVHSPIHYNSGGIECIAGIKASMSHEAYCGFLKGNIEKYLWRYEHKNGIEDLKKAKVYLDWLIEEAGGER